MEKDSLAVEQTLGPCCSNSFGERYFFNINRSSFSKTSAQALFEAKFADKLFREDELNIIVGTDSGLLPHYVQNKQLPRGSRFIFIEPESVLHALHAKHLLDDLDAERIACITMETWEQTILNFKIREYFYIQAVQSFNAICAEDDFIQEYAELSWHVTEVLSQLHWINTVELGSEAFISRQLINVADNAVPAILLENAFPKKTVVLLAGGPSLDDALPWVRLHRQDLVVFAVSRISRQLLQAEISPDFVFSVDPTELSFDISKEMLTFGNETTFICSHHTVPALVNQWLGRILYLGTRLPWKSTLNVNNISSAGPTVTNTAISVAYSFGFNRIILAGVDLCFTKEGFTHAKGSNEHLAGPRFNLTSLQVETNDGFMAPSSCDFVQAIASLDLQAKQLKDKGCRLINVSGQAAKVENIEYMPLEQIELDDNRVNVADIVAERVDSILHDAKGFENMVAELQRARFQIKTIAGLAEKARRINDSMYNAQGVIENYKDKKKLDQIEKKFKRELRHFSRLVKAFGIRRFLTLTKPFLDEEMTPDEAKQFGNVFYDVYHEGATKLIGLLDDAINRGLARQTENAPVPDFSMFIAQCRKDKSFGRAGIWRRKKADIVIPAEIAEIFTEFDRQFAEILKNKDTRHFANAKNHSSLAILKQRAGLLFKHKKLDELEALQSGLAKHQQQADAAPYRHLLNGYIAELKAEPEVALEAYQQIVEAADALLEEALVRIAGISIDLNYIDSANLSLQCLSQLNPLYLPMYAEMQRLEGNTVTAIDAYNTYISRFPDDTLTQLKLATLYAEQKIFAAAEMMLDYILRSNPNLEAAAIIKTQLQVLKNAEIELAG